MLLSGAVRSRLHYVAERAEAPPLAAGAIDLVTVAQAIHWFEFGEDYAETCRVPAGGGVLAAWTYRMFESDPAIDGVMRFFRSEPLRGYWPDRFVYVDALYRNLPFPLREIEAPPFFMEADWNMDELAGFTGS